MQNMAQDLHLGDKIKVAGITGKVVGIQMNNMNGVILNLRIKGSPRPKGYGKSARKARQRARMTLIVPRNQLLTVVPR